MQVGQGFGGALAAWVGVGSSSPQVPCHVTVMCDSGVKGRFLTFTASFDPKLSMNSWLSKLESSCWLDHVQSVLTTASFVVQCLDKQGIFNVKQLQY